MVLAPSERCTLSSDNGLSLSAVSFHSAGVFRAAVGPFVVCQKTIWHTRYVALLKYPFWPGNLFSLWHFAQLFWAQPCFFNLDLPTPGVWRQTFQFFRNVQYMPSKLPQEEAGLYRQCHFLLCTSNSHNCVHPVQGVKQEFHRKSNAQLFFFLVPKVSKAIEVI